MYLSAPSRNKIGRDERGVKHLYSRLWRIYSDLINEVNSALSKTVGDIGRAFDRDRFDREPLRLSFD